MNLLLPLSLLMLLLLAVPAAARVAAPLNVVQRTARADAVIVGKVSAIEKDAVAVAPSPDAAKVDHTVAVIKVEAALAGVTNVTHVKVGFVPSPPADPKVPVPPRRGFAPVELKEGQEGLYFLTKHPSGQFYTINVMTPPVDAQADSYKADVELARRATAAIADPMTALKAEKPAERFFAAAALVIKYRTAPNDAGEVEFVKASAEESKLILKALAEEPDWSKPSLGPVTGTQAFFMLGLTDKDGWTPPRPQPGVPADTNAVHREAFVKWVAAGGKDYQVNRLAAKKK